MDNLTDGATKFANLPLAPESRSWSGSAARQRMKEFCGGDPDLSEMDWEQFAKGHFWVDPARKDQMGGYKLPFADIVDGKMAAVWNGVNAALQRLDSTEITEADKAAVKAHIKRYYKKFKKDFPEAASEAEAILERLGECETFDDADDILCDFDEQHPDWTPEEDDALTEAVEQVRQTADSLLKTGRTQIADTYKGTVRIVDHLDDGRLRVQAVFGQVDVKNANRRLYPKSEAPDWIERANRAAKRGRMVGCDGHGDVFGSTSYRDVVLRFESFALKGNDLYFEGLTVPTAVGKDVEACFESGINVEFSKLGYGNPEDVSKKNGDYDYSIIHDYVLDRVDVVLRGADKTRTVSLAQEGHNPANPIGDGGEGDEMDKDEKTTETPPVAETPPAPPTPEPVVPPTPTVDADAVVSQVLAGLKDSVGPIVTEVATQATNAAMAAAALERRKAELLAGVEDEKYRVPIERALASATTVAEADERFAEYKPMLDAAILGAEVPSGVGIVTDATRRRVREQSWYMGGEVVERPRTAEGVLAALKESYPSNSKPSWSDPKKVFSKLLDTMYEDPECARYFSAASRDGIKAADTAFGTTQLGTITPLILPMMRDLYPMLIPFELFSVQPLAGPSGVIHSLHFLTGVEEYDLSESEHFDSTYSDHTEAAAKKAIKPRVVQTTVTARTKSIQFNPTMEVRQDFRATLSLDLDQEMIQAATDQLAREVNLTFLGNVLGGATAGSLTWGTKPPTGSYYTGKDWNDRLSIFVAKASSYVSQKMLLAPDWIVYGPGIAPYIEAMGSWAAMEGNRITFGNGLSRTGTIGGGIQCYRCDWFAAISSGNKALLGFRPPTWMQTGAVYAPYIPLYISPEDYDANTNTYARSVSTRFAQVVTSGDAFSVITAQDYAGTDLSTVV